MLVEAIARKWHDQLLSTDPIDHQQAESAMRAVYRAADLPEPERFLWCASPLEAVWSFLVLVGRTDGYGHAVHQDVERSKSGRERLATARASLAAQLGIAEDEIEGYFGKPFYTAEGTNPVSKVLQAQQIDVWMARAKGGDDYLAIHKGGPFKPLHDLEQALHFEGNRGGKGCLYVEALSAAANKHVAILGGRSAHHRLYGNLAYSEVAVDEALAALGKFAPTPLQQCMWAAYQACGMWWPCHRGVIFAERPAAVEGSGTSIGMRWADGFTVGQISASPPARHTAVAAPPPAPSAADAAILGRRLPANHDARIAELRRTGPLPLFDRYLAGEHEQVWRELVALGGDVRSEGRAADALAVAYETMHRVDRNVRLLAGRLESMNYRFVYPGSGGGFFGLGKAKAHHPHTAPPANVHAKIAELETMIGGPLPLSLRCFFEVVGDVNFNGDHPAIAPKEGSIAPDPLMVCGVEEAIAMVDGLDRGDDDLVPIEFAPDALHKANVSGGAPYAIQVPDESADAPVENAPHEVMFVEYLRIAFQWGGFPGWEYAPSIPSQFDSLRDGLLPF